ncbi:20714_t:CDS:2 [Cetraspora pellucida]|uniref:20714_t:CDS:1 n=1 Tax=Cetraspora pellucida TaxID=1433469 RepID=A0A9N9DXZ2_9GLOM|nr:20714_t:CDS:2 [Cetraspora pellucida]
MNTNTITVPKAELDFLTFEEAYTFIENYAAQTNIVVILTKITKNKDGSDYRQVFFAYKKQEQYNKHNYEINPDSRKFSSNMHKFSPNELGIIEELHDNRLQIKNIYAVLASISSNEIHQHWHVQYNAEVDHIPQLATNIFKKLPECYHNALLNIMQSASEYILKDGKMPKLQKDLNILQHNNLNTTNVDDITNYEKIKIPAVKHNHSHSSNKKHILGADEIIIKKKNLKRI